MNTYQATSEYGVAVYGENVFDADFTAADERDHLLGGHLKIVPRAYRVVSDNNIAGGQGSTVELALSMETEAALISGGQLERLDEPVEEPTEDDEPETVEEPAPTEEPTEEEEEEV